MKKRIITPAFWLLSLLGLCGSTPTMFKSHIVKQEAAYARFSKQEKMQLIPAINLSQQSKAAITFPYKENFETGSAWTITDANSKMSIGALTGITALSGSSYLISMYDAANSRNAWAISPAVALVANTTYYVYVNYYSPGYSGVKDEFKITVGSGATSASQTTVLLDKSGTNAVATSAWTYVEMSFTPSQSGDYYFGINHCTVAKDVNAVAFEDFVVSETKVIPAPVATVSSFGGLFSMTSDSVYVSPAEKLLYFANTSNVQEYSWLFDENNPDTIQYKGNAAVGVAYANPGRHIASLDVLGLNGTTLSPMDTCYISRPEDKTDFVWNVGLSDKLSIYTTGTSNNFALGLNSSYKKISELYSLPSGQKTTLSGLVIYLYYYQLSTTNRAKNFTITVQAVDPATGYPGTVLATYTPTFSSIFGTATISGTMTSKTYTLSTPLSLTGSFYVTYDYTNAGTPSATNRIGVISTSERSFGYGTSYIYYQNAWQYYGDLSAGYGVKLTYVKPTVTSVESSSSLNGWGAYVQGSSLHVQNAVAGSELCLFDSMGRLIQRVRLTKNNEIMALQLTSGVYYAVMNKRTIKLIVK